MSATSKPNLLFIWTDQQSANTLGAYGNDHIDTSNVDDLAEQAAVFENAYVTQPVCGPSRSSIMTGLYPHTSGITENNIPLPSHMDCFPEIGDFDEYKTAFIGKWHLGNEIFSQHGFDEMIGVEDQYRRFYSEDYDKKAHCAYYHFLRENGFSPDVEDEDGFDWFSRTFSADIPEQYSKPAFMAREAKKFIQETHQPFILHVMFLEPHSPYTSPRDDQYNPEDVPLPPNFDHDGFEDQPLRIRLIREAIRQGVYNVPRDVIGENPGEEEWRRMISNYWGLVSLVDTYVGEILGALEKSDRADDTIVAYTSDHGDMMGSHQLVSKMVMFEEAIRIPLMLRVPGAQRNGERVSDPVSQIDLVPTLLDAMDQPTPEYLQGKSWIPFLNGEDDLPKEEVIVEWNGPNVAGIRGRVPRDMSPGGEFLDSARPQVKPEFLDAWSGMAEEEEILQEMLDPVRTIITSDGWKLNYHGSGRCELYDLDSDRAETDNLAEEDEYDELIDELAERIFQWQKRYRDPVYLH